MIMSIVSAGLYALFAALILAHTLNKPPIPKMALIAIGNVVLLIHGYLLLIQVHGAFGQNFGLFNVLSLVLWLCTVILMFGIRKRNNESLLFFLAPLTASAILLASLFPSTQIVRLDAGWEQLVHIVAALSAYALLVLAAVQAIMMQILDRRLRSQPGHIGPLLPPMQTMEHFLFQLISAGFVLLTLSMLTAFIYLWEETKNQAPHKLFFSLCAWLTFSGLLIGRFRYGWRGKTAIRWTLIGVFMLVLAYFGTKFVLEFLLAR